MDIDTLNLKLKNYDDGFYKRLEPVIQKISSKSKALASNLKDCIDKLRLSDRYLRANLQETVATKESDLDGEEFEIFRKYVRLLRSCTIMCGQDVSKEFKELFLEFFSGERLQLAQKLN